VDIATRLEKAKVLVRELEAGNETAAEQILEDMAREREVGLFFEIGKLTRELHDALGSMRMDSRLAGIAEQDIPDARERLNYVIEKTEEAAHRTLNAVEDSLPLSARLRTEADRIDDDWGRFRRREMSLEEFRSFNTTFGGFIEEVRNTTVALNEKLSDVLLAQDYQDLTGQVIRRVIELVEEVEESLVRLIRSSGVQMPASSEGQAQPVGAVGPQVLKSEQAATVAGQDDVDDLLSSLGF